MKIKALVILLLVSALGFGCKNSNENGCPVLPVALQLLQLNVRIVDKTTDSDLFLSPSSPYKLSDLQITSSITGSNVEMFVDSAKKDDRHIVILANESQSFILKLASLPGDTINMSVAVNQSKCSETKTINAITLNKNVICTPCGESQVITIKK